MISIFWCCIWGSHSGDWKVWSFWLQCHVVLRKLNISEGHICYHLQDWRVSQTSNWKKWAELAIYFCWLFAFLTLQPWRWRLCVPQKHWASSELHGITTDKTVFFIVFSNVLSLRSMTELIHVWTPLCTLSTLRHNWQVQNWAGWYSSSAVELYLGGAHFEFQQGHWLS